MRTLKRPAQTLKRTQKRPAQTLNALAFCGGGEAYFHIIKIVNLIWIDFFLKYLLG